MSAPKTPKGARAKLPECIRVEVQVEGVTLTKAQLAALHRWALTLFEEMPDVRSDRSHGILNGRSITFSSPDFYRRADIIKQALERCPHCGGPARIEDLIGDLVACPCAEAKGLKMVGPARPRLSLPPRST